MTLSFHMVAFKENPYHGRMSNDDTMGDTDELNE